MLALVAVLLMPDAPASAQDSTINGNGPPACQPELDQLNQMAT